jgi:hypothetical protein
MFSSDGFVFEMTAGKIPEKTKIVADRTLPIKLKI